MNILKILFRWGLIFVLPLILIITIVNYTYNPCELCEGDIHRHTMGPWFGIIIGIWFWGGICLLGFFLEILYRYFRRKKII